MDVHHHREVETKSFKEYILEGLMIFLAVTMGFTTATKDGLFSRDKVKQLLSLDFDEKQRQCDIEAARIQVPDNIRIAVNYSIAHYLIKTA